MMNPSPGRAWGVRPTRRGHGGHGCGTEGNDPQANAAGRCDDGEPHLLLRVVAEFLLAGLMSWSELAAHLAGPLWPPSGHRLPARVTGGGSVVVTASHEISTDRGMPVTGTR